MALMAQTERGTMPELPLFLVEDILNRLEDARDIAKAQLLNKDWRDASNNLRSLRIRCLDENHERARDMNADVTYLRSKIPGKSDEGESSSYQPLSFKEQVEKIVENNYYIVQLRAEVESKLQARTVPESKYVAFNLEVMEPPIVEIKCMAGLQELLYGASRFTTLSSLIDQNPNLRKIFLDIPCMALGEDGRFLGVLKDVPSMLPNFSKLHECGTLEVLNIGPGLWYCMETNVETLVSLEKLPSMNGLILHMIPQNLDPAIKVLRMLLRLSVKFLTIYVHTSSPVKLDELKTRIEAVLSDCEQHIDVIISTWAKNVDLLGTVKFQDTVMEVDNPAGEAVGGVQGNMPILPQHLLADILDRVENATSIAKAQCVSKDFRDAGYQVQSLHIVVLNLYHERARDNIDVLRSLRSGISGEALVSDGGASSSAGSSPDVVDGRFKNQMVKFLEKKRDIVELRIEVESKLQEKIVPEDERRRTDFWISDPWFLGQWLTQMDSILQHLTIVDYGQQAIMRSSSIIRILSRRCKRLKTLDLANMFIHTGDCEQMPLMTSLTLRSVKVPGGALQHINDIMPKLQTLALLGVFGVEGGNLTCPNLKVIRLGLSTPANDVKMDLPKLEVLQLKMQCPRKLRIRASALKHVAVNLDVLEPPQWQLRYDYGLIKLLYPASSFITLSSLAEKDPNLDTPCVDQTLDIPCMALLKNGRYSDILNDTPVNIPRFSRLHECGNSEVTPGLLQWKQEIPGGLNLQMNVL